MRRAGKGRLLRKIPVFLPCSDSAAGRGGLEGGGAAVWTGMAGSGLATSSRPWYWWLLCLPGLRFAPPGVIYGCGLFEAFLWWWMRRCLRGDGAAGRGGMGGGDVAVWTGMAGSGLATSSRPWYGWLLCFPGLRFAPPGVIHGPASSRPFSGGGRSASLGCASLRPGLFMDAASSRSFFGGSCGGVSGVTVPSGA